MEIKRINFKHKVQPLTLFEIEKSHINLVSDDKVSISRKGIIHLVSILSTFKMAVRNDSTLDQREKLFNSIGNNQYPITNTLRSYIACQLEVINEVCQESLEDLVKSTYPKSSIIDHRLINFAFCDVIENISLIRMSEFGYFCLGDVSHKILIDIPNNSLDSFHRHIKPIRDQSIINKIDERILKAPKSVTNNLQEESYRFLLRMFNYNHNKSKVNRHIAYQFGLDMTNQLHYFIKHWKQLKQAVELIVDNGLKQNIKQGPKL